MHWIYIVNIYKYILFYFHFIYIFLFHFNHFSFNQFSFHSIIFMCFFFILVLALINFITKINNLWFCKFYCNCLKFSINEIYFMLIISLFCLKKIELSSFSFPQLFFVRRPIYFGWLFLSSFWFLFRPNVIFKRK